jgi:hypothetical protein
MGNPDRDHPAPSRTCREGKEDEAGVALVMSRTVRRLTSCHVPLPHDDAGTAWSATMEDRDA